MSGTLGESKASLRQLRRWRGRAMTILVKAEALRREMVGEPDAFSDRADNIAVEAEELEDLLVREIAARPEQSR